MAAALTLVASVAVGFAVGMLSGLFGIGGGGFLVPIFSLAFGMSAISSTATSLFTIIPTSISGATARIRNGTCVVGVGLAAGIGGALTSPVGVLLASVSPDWAIMTATAIVIAYSAVNMFRKAFELRAQRLAADSAAKAAGDAGVRADFKMTKRAALLSALTGAVAGVLSGYVGLGGGFLIVPMTMALLGLSLRLASGSSLLAVIMLAIPATIMQAGLGNIDWLVGASVVVGSIPGAVLGARFAKHAPELFLRFAFGTVLLVASVLLVLNQVIA